MTSLRGLFRPALLGTLLSLPLANPGSAQRVSGSLDAKGYGYFSRSTPSDPLTSGWATAFLKADGKLSRLTFAVSIRLELISSDENGPLVFDPADREIRRTAISIREFWLRIPLLPSTDLELGRFELGWGKTDGYSPADSFLPRDLSDPFADERLPLWGARVRSQFGSFRVDAVGIPITTPFRLPPLSGRNAPIESPLPGVRVFLVDGENPVPRTGFLAVRLLATQGNWDVGLWGRSGVRPAPLLTPRMDRARPSPEGIAIPADRSYTHEEALGLEASRVTGAFILRGELAWLTSGDPQLGNAIIWTAGLERAFGDGNLLVTFAANAMGTERNPALLFDRALLPALISIWSRQEDWGSWRTVWMQGTRYWDGLVKVESTFSADDHLSFTPGVDWVYGSRRGPFGYRPDTARARFFTRYSW